MTGDAGMELRSRAARGELEALTSLVLSHGRQLAGMLACHADSWDAVELMQRRVWAEGRLALADGGALGPWMAQQVPPVIDRHLDDAGREAIAKRDSVRHLLVQTALEDLASAPAGSAVPVEHVACRL